MLRKLWVVAVCSTALPLQVGSSDSTPPGSTETYKGFTFVPGVMQLGRRLMQNKFPLN